MGETQIMSENEYKSFFKERLWNEYDADCRDGFVSNIDTWLELKINEYPELTFEEGREHIDEKLGLK